MLACILATIELVAIASDTLTSVGIEGGGRQLLQIKSKKAPGTFTQSQDSSNCKLPEDGTWAWVRLDGLPPFQMAVRTGDDILSRSILTDGFWEYDSMSDFGPPGIAFDIGGNIGAFTFALAQAGWKVYTFEPMPQNIAFINATLCQNPMFAAHVKLFEMGLSTRDQTCQMIASHVNKGNGVVQCSGDGNLYWENSSNFNVMGTFPIRRLDDVLNENQISTIDFVKVDVEGYECEVFQGAPSLLTQFRPRLVHTEVWNSMVHCTPRQFLDMFSSQGYKIGRETDPFCLDQILDDEVPSDKVGVADFFMCLGQASPQTPLQNPSTCPLPENGTWAWVRLNDLPPFQMAVRTGDDILSQSILADGYWEYSNMSVFGSPGAALDIGGNIGAFTFTLAQAGWKVYTFEPMPQNIEFIKATLCQNPTFAAHVKLFEMGLSTRDQTCQMIASHVNKGNGVVQCSGDGNLYWENSSNFNVMGTFPIRRLEDVLNENQISSIDFVKVDVEGYECEVFQGAPSLLSRIRPRLIHAEVWNTMVHCTPKQFLDMFSSQGYKIGRETDPSCIDKILDDEVPSDKVGVADFFMCRG